MTEDRGHPSPRRSRGRPPHPDVLTPAEWRVLDALRLGHTNAEIAERLGLSVNTVRTHVSSMLAKLELPDRHALATWPGAPAEAPRARLRRLSLLAPWLRGVGLAAALLVFALVMWAALDATRSTPHPLDELVADAGNEVVPLSEVYDPQPFDSPAIYSQCCTRMWFPTRIAPPSLAAAEAEAALYLEDAEPPDSPLPAAFEGVPGTADHRCVDASTAGTDRRVRSGDVVLDTSAWAAPDYVFAVFPHEVSSGLFLRATRLDGSPDPATQVHELDGGATRASASDSWQFRPSVILPEPGTWLVVATVGAQWGCFLVDAPEPPDLHRPARTVADAEVMGAAYPSEPAPAYLSPSFLADRGPDVRQPGLTGWEMRGFEDRACLDVTGAHDARSGEWVLRPVWTLFTDANPRSPGTKFIAIPEHQPRTLAEARSWEGTPREHLRLTATLLDAPQHTYVYEQRDMNAYVGSEDAGTLELTHVAGAVMPRNDGTCLLIATDGLHGTQWGCFVAPHHLPVAYP